MKELELLNLDYELSVEVFEKCKEFMEKKSCYKNIALSFLEYVDYQDKFKDIKISFGGFKPVDCLTGENIYYRHCFYILDNKVIDPTLILLLNKDMGKVDIGLIKAKTLYFNVISFDKEDYREKLIDCTGVTSLDKYTLKALNNFQTKLYLEKNILLVG